MNYYLESPHNLMSRYHSTFFDNCFIFSSEDFYSKSPQGQVIGDHIREGTFHTVISQIVDIVTQNNCSTILIEITGNVWTVDTEYVQIAFDALSQIAPTKIISNDYRDFYNPGPNTLFFPLWQYAFIDSKLSKGVRKNISLHKSLPAMCFNHNAPWHRILFYTLLSEKKLLPKIQYSFLYNPSNESDPFSYTQLTQDEIKNFEKYKNCLPISIDQQFSINDVAFDGQCYDDCAINIVTETTVDITFVSGKSSKPFVANQIPILVAGPGANQFLSDLGLDLFEDIIPWKIWDSNPDSRYRIYSVVNFLNSFLQQDILALYQELCPRIEKNKEYFFSQKFQNLLTSKIKLWNS